MVYNDGKFINTKDLLIAYKVIKEIMNEHNLKSDTAWRHVQCWLSNKICDQLQNEDIINDNLLNSNKF